jgi:hypothetical protein
MIEHPFDCPADLRPDAPLLCSQVDELDPAW